MPTASGRETASEKRARQDRARWAAIDARIATLPPGWADAEARAVMDADHALRAAGRPLYEHGQREYATEHEAYAVARAVRALTGAPYVAVVRTFELTQADSATPWHVEAPR